MYVQSIFHEDEGQLQVHTTNLNTASENYDMKISLSKSETMKVSRTPGPHCIKLFTIKKIWLTSRVFPYGNANAKTMLTSVF